jgi:hypothetical protein
MLPLVLAASTKTKTLDFFAPLLYQQILNHAEALVLQG